MKIQIDSDEWYPVYYMYNGCGTGVDVPEATVERWKRVFEEFEAVQNEMQAAIKDASAAGGQFNSTPKPKPSTRSAPDSTAASWTGRSSR